MITFKSLIYKAALVGIKFVHAPGKSERNGVMESRMKYTFTESVPGHDLACTGKQERNSRTCSQTKAIKSRASSAHSSLWKVPERRLQYHSPVSAHLAASYAGECFCSFRSIFFLLCTFFTYDKLSFLHLIFFIIIHFFYIFIFY